MFDPARPKETDSKFPIFRVVTTAYKKPFRRKNLNFALNTGQITVKNVEHVETR
jgi:uncharacterized membrane protein YesL